jgi:hypothetical protein
MIATRYNSSALLKSEIDRLDYRLSELESSTRLIGMKLAKLKEQVKPDEPSEARPEVVRRPDLRPLPPPKIKIVKIKRVTRGGGRTKKLFTDEVMANIPLWIAEGLTREQIAEKIGCTMNSLQATCSKKGVSLWRKDRAPMRRRVIIVRQEEVEEKLEELTKELS